MKTPRLTHPAIRIALAAMLLGHISQAADFDWNQTDTPNEWSLNTNWTPTAAVGGPDAAGVSILINTNIASTSTINLFNTGNPGDATKTIGRLDIGDANNSHGYTIAAGTGSGVLNFDGNGTNAQLNQLSTSGNNTISAPITLTSSLDISNAASANLLTISGGITAASVGLKTVTTSTGPVTISGVIGDGSGQVAVVQNGAGTLTLSGNNTFTGGVTIKNGTVVANADASLGTGTLLLGDTSGNEAATLALNSFTVANNITVQSGSTGLLTISNNVSSSARPTGNILLNNDLTIRTDGSRINSNQGALFSAAGTISGAGDLSLNVTGIVSTTNNTNNPQMANLSITGPLTLTGGIYNTGTGNGWASISGNITNASSINQSSATSMLQLSGTNTYSGNTSVDAGVLRISSASALSANSASVNVASGGTLQLASVTITNVGQTLNLSGFGTSYSYGALDSTNNGAYGGSIVLQNDAAISSDLATTTLTLSGSISGSGKTLTTSGVGITSITNSIATGAGGVTKLGTGVLTLGGSNSYTGLTRISGGFLSVNSANALGGGGNITFDGGAIRHNAANLVDYGSKIVNSTGPISIDTNGQNVASYSGIASSNSGGLSKLGTGRLTLTGTNSFSGLIAINAGVLAVSTTSAIPSLGTGQIFIDTNGALNTGGAYSTLGSWLSSGNIASGSTGVIAITGANSDNIDFTGYSSLGLGATTNATYTGTITPTGSTYRLGGGGAVLTLSGTNALTGNTSLVVSGGVTLSGANNLSGATAVNSGTLTLTGAAGGLASSAISVNSGSTLAITSNTAAGAVTRANSLNLNRGILTVAGNNSANSTDSITGALNFGSDGNSIVTLNVAASSTKNTLLTAGSLTRSAGSTALIRGANLGANNITPATANSTNLQIGSVTLVGGTGGNGTDEGIIVGAVGDTTSGGSGFGATGGLLTSDASKGVRLVSAYKTSITDGQSQLDNIRLSSASGTATTTLASTTTINSLSFDTSATAGSNVQVTGAGALTISSGVIHSRSVTATTASGISNAIDFNGREGVILAGGSADLTLSGVLSNTGGNGLTIYGNKNVNFTGTSANTYNGTTTVNGGTLTLGKTAGINSVAGNLTVNSGGSVTLGQANQIADTANVNVNGGTFTFRTETINDLTVTNGGAANSEGGNGIALNVNGDLVVSNDASLRTSVAGPLTVAGSTSLTNGGSITLARSQNTSGNYDSFASLQDLTITNKASGAYTAITIGFGSGLGQSGAKLALGGDVTFIGNATNANSVLIDSIKGTGRQGIIELTPTAGSRTFNVGNGAASVDLVVTAPMVDGAGASGLTKSGNGTLALTGASSYTGETTVTAGTLLVNNITGSGLGGGNAVINSGGKLGGSGAFTGSVTVNSGGTLAPGSSIESLASGALSFANNSSFGYEVDFGALPAVGADLQVVTGNLNLSGNVTLTLTNLTAGTFAVNTKFTLINYSGSWNNGLFTYLGNSLADGSTFSFNGQDWSIDYNASSGGSNFSSEQLGVNFVTMTAVPEPTTWALLAFSLTTVILLRRRRS